MNKDKFIKIRVSEPELDLFRSKHEAFNRLAKVKVSFSQYIRRKIRLGN